MSLLAVVGNSGSGKTLLCEQVAAALVDDGLRVAYVKHAAHGFDPGRVGSDSGRVRAAGADPVAVLGPGGLLQVHAGGGSAEELLTQVLTGLRGEVVLLEGFSAGPWPKVRVSLAGAAPREVAEPVLADVSRPADGPFPDDVVRAVVKLLAEQRDRIGPDRASLHADGREVPLRGFAQSVVASTVRGLTAALRGVDDPDRLELRLERRRDGRA
ncbi:MAG: molybdopterin-guanine dinucleotide biosynthesis protein B [Nitriliruptoraceae bacterium]